MFLVCSSHTSSFIKLLKAEVPQGYLRGLLPLLLHTFYPAFTIFSDDLIFSLYVGDSKIEMLALAIVAQLVGASSL